MKSNLKYKETFSEIENNAITAPCITRPCITPPGSTPLHLNISNIQAVPYFLNEESETKNPIINKPSARNIAALIILISFQILDGIFTYKGISKFGVDIEANPIIHNLIGSFGEILALSLTKLSCIIAILFLWSLRNKVSWISKSIEFISLYYLLFAIIPWTVILAQN